MRKVFPTIDVQAVRLRCSKFKDHIVPITELGTIDQYSLPITSRKAAVLIPLCMFKGLPSVLFTLRSSRVSTHKNQVSFPGGHIDKDKSAIDAAIRETREELGPNIGEIEIISICQTIPAITGTLVTPVIGFMTKPFIDYNLFQPSEKEVDRIFIRSLKQLTDPSYKSYEPYERNGITLMMPVFGEHEKEERIWGLTAFILDSVLEKIILPEMEEKLIKTHDDIGIDG
mmetsp:Transcript_27660/g.26471  ORF Transcript_27660/g.26471 Transcript_27660/m.26471 type:complete len:228 (-) Transcript_27660:628-1311(-)